MHANEKLMIQWEYEDEDADDYEWEYSEEEEEIEEAKENGKENGKAGVKEDDEDDDEEDIPLDEQDLPDPFSAAPLEATTKKEVILDVCQVQLDPQFAEKTYLSAPLSFGIPVIRLQRLLSVHWTNVDAFVLCEFSADLILFGWN